MGGVVEHPSVPEDVYAKIPVDDLVLYAAKRVLDSSEECTSERLVYECFTLFPKQFCLQRYPQWPDSARVNKSWWRCRTDKGWLAGSVQEGFRLTPKGGRVADQVAAKLSAGKGAKARPSQRPRERYEAVLRYIRKNELFARFNADLGGFRLTEMEMRNFLGGTLETPVRVLRQNLHYYVDVAGEYGDKEVARFLAVCKQALENVLKKTTKVRLRQ